MKCCNLYSSPFLKNLKVVNKEDIKTNIIRSLLKPFDPKMSGLWQPIVLDDTIKGDLCNLFIRSSLSSSLDPCDCVNVNAENTSGEDAQLDCEYCNQVQPGYSFTWKLTNKKTGDVTNNITSDYCSGANDVRTQPDDYLTKLPTLNNSYATGVYDFKYLNEFPAVSNPGIGIKEVFSHRVSTETFDFFDFDGEAYLNIDWLLEPKIGEIEPNDVDSYHKTISDHEKSYNRYLMTNKTCGNFILIKPNEEYYSNPNSSEQEDEEETSVFPRYPLLDSAIGFLDGSNVPADYIPSPDSFIIPYGFDNNNHYNIFVKGNEKVGSHWKWEQTSGILGWYRYFDVDLTPEEDDRLIPKVDLYISPGDVFFAKNQGPELSPNNGGTNDNEDNDDSPEILECPSGLKLLDKNNKIRAVIPDGSEFVYISENIYNKAYNIFGKLIALENASEEEDVLTPKQKLELSCILATHPNHDEVTVDLLKRTKNTTNSYDRNDFKQIDLFNKNMLKKPISSANRLNIVKTEKDLVNTLANKYGCYLYIKPNSSVQLSCNTTNTNFNAFFDLDFEPVIEKKDIIGNEEAVGAVDCGLSTIKKKFYYDQSIGVGSNFIETKQDYDVVNRFCDSGRFEPTGSAKTASLLFNEQTFKTIIYNTGSINYENIYKRPVSYDLAADIIGIQTLCDTQGFCKANGEYDDDSVKLIRGYPASFFNPNIDLCGFHADGGVYCVSNEFGEDTFFLKDFQDRQSAPFIKFTTKDIGIKLYSLSIEKLRDKKYTQCKTFPLDQPCKCFPLKQVYDYPYRCDGTLTFSNKKFYTPNLSTHNIDIKGYGNYTSEELLKRYDGKPINIPNHVQHQQHIPLLKRKIDPINPYECEKNIRINLPNYIYMDWVLGLDKYTTNHSDVWVSIDEDADLVRQVVPFFNEETEELEFQNNEDYQRYTNKVVVNGTSLWNDQTRVLFGMDTSIPNRFDIEITNPYLYALIEEFSANIEADKLLYVPLPCFSDYASSTNLTSFLKQVSDLYLSSINITFTQKPRTQLLLYLIQPLAPQQNMRKHFFHPNHGLVAGRDETSLKFDKDKCSFDFEYEKLPFLGQDSYNDTGYMYSSVIDKNEYQILEIINSLKNNKKIRLYINSNGIWYEYINPHLFGFYNKLNNSVYPGVPTFFEYTSFDKPKILLDNKNYYTPDPVTQKTPIITKPSALIPASPKTNVKFSYYTNPFNQIFFDRTYPKINWDYTSSLDNGRAIVLDTIRPYFFFEEQLIFREIATIESLSSNDNSISFGTVLKDNENNYWKYYSGPTNEKYSYELLDDSSYYDKNFSSLHFTFTQESITRDGALHSSFSSVVPKTITLQDKNNIDKKKDYVVIGKYLLADEENLKVKTVLVLNICEECLVDPLEGRLLFKDDIDHAYLTTYIDLKDSIKKEYSNFLTNTAIPYQTKWGDLLFYDFDENFDLNNSKYIQEIINNEYPLNIHENKYKNIVDSLLVNHLSTGNNHLYITYNQFVQAGVPDRRFELIVPYTGETYYVQHQKYHSDMKYSYTIPTEQYENFIPLFDLSFINYMNNNPELSQLIRTSVTNEQNSVKTTGLMLISGVRQFVVSGNNSYPEEEKINVPTNALSYIAQKNIDNFISPDKDSYIIFNLDKTAKVKPVLFDKPFYYPSLRVDETYFEFTSNKYMNNSVTSTSGCAELAFPNIDYLDAGEFKTIFSANGFNKISDNIPRKYFQSLIYCDTDNPGNCDGSDKSCSYKVAGNFQLEATYKHLEYIEKTFDEIKNNNMQYVLSVDEGLFTFLNGDITTFPYIQRVEIPDDDGIFNFEDSKSGVFNVNEYYVVNRDVAPKLSYLDELYQDKLQQYINNQNHTDLVKATDQAANEMLFRVLHGTRQHINTENIKKKTITDIIKKNKKIDFNNLIQYNAEQFTADKIYDLIPYDYSKLSDQSRRKVSGGITVQGVPKIGANFSITIDDVLISFSIVEREGKILIEGSHGSTVASGELGSRYIETTSLSAIARSTPPGPMPEPPDEYTTIRKIGECGGGYTSSWRIGSYYSAMSYERETIGEDGVSKTYETVDLVAEYQRCLAAARPEGECAQKGITVCRCPTSLDPPIDGNVLSNTFEPGGGPCNLNCRVCNSRGWAPGPYVETNCSVVTQTSKNITWNGIGRSTFSHGGDGLGDQTLGCAPRKGGVSTSVWTKEGSFDSVVGGTPVLGMAAFINCAQKNYECGAYCAGIEEEDKYGKIFDPLSHEYRKSFVSNIAGDIPCECRPYNYGYCKTTSTSCDECFEYDAGSPKNFSYNFENQYLSYTSYGHAFRLEKGSPIEHNGVVYKSPGCDVKEPQGISLRKAEATEECYWLRCTNPDTLWDIFEYVQKIPTEYNPTCPQYLGSVSYDNNTITVFVVNGPTICIDHEIRNDCPLLTVNLPDSTFSFSDYINSECSMCDVESNQINMNLQHPDWNIITETRTMILDILAIDGEINEDLANSPVNASTYKINCGPVDPNECDRATDQGGQLYQCGKRAPESWGWSYVLNCELNGSPNPSFTPCIKEFVDGQGTAFSTLVNVKRAIGFAEGASNSTAATQLTAYWKQKAQEKYNDVQICNKNRGSINIEDIVEGVVPGSCSPVKFSTISFPATAYRQTLGGGQTTSIQYNVEVAYFTYEYRRPKTIEDIFLGDELAVKCSTVIPHNAGPFSPTSSYNMSEEYGVKLEDCQTTPNCYDTTIEICDEQNICCKNNLPTRRG